MPKPPVVYDGTVPADTIVMGPGPAPVPPFGAFCALMFMAAYSLARYAFLFCRRHSPKYR